MAHRYVFKKLDGPGPGTIRREFMVYYTTPITCKRMYEIQEAANHALGPPYAFGWAARAEGGLQVLAPLPADSEAFKLVRFVPFYSKYGQGDCEDWHDGLKNGNIPIPPEALVEPMASHVLYPAAQPSSLPTGLHLRFDADGGCTWTQAEMTAVVDALVSAGGCTTTGKLPTYKQRQNALVRERLRQHRYLPY